MYSDADIVLRAITKYLGKEKRGYFKGFYQGICARSEHVVAFLEMQSRHGSQLRHSSSCLASRAAQYLVLK